MKSYPWTKFCLFLSPSVALDHDCCICLFIVKTGQASLQGFPPYSHRHELEERHCFRNQGWWRSGPLYHPTHSWLPLPLVMLWSCLIYHFHWTCDLVCLTEYSTWWAIWAKWSLDVSWLSAAFFFSRSHNSQEAVFQKVYHSPLWETLYPESYWLCYNFFFFFFAF